FKATVVAIDLPTGMFCDKSSVQNPIIKANYTLTFQSLKLCFLMAENAPFAGHVSIMNIGLSPEFLETINTDKFLIAETFANSIYIPRPDFAHKGTCGHALLIAGSEGKMGAAILCAKACLRAGAGLVTMKVPHNEISILQISIPEAMCLVENKIDFDKYQSAGIGPGLGKEKDALEILKSLLYSSLSKYVLDADALNLIAENPELIEHISEQAVITPHPKEFDRLFGEMKNDFERFEKAVALSTKYPFTIVLKGHHTCVAKNGKAFFNLTGNSGMATGGMGDALTGIITSLLAQGYDSMDAAILGVYLHGLAGDLCLREQSVESLLPSDLIDYLGQAFMQLHFPQV
ncbi:MAG: NAD(P)H-hydrate dehydratase, partial [Chitinophagaceae bacterium]